MQKGIHGLQKILLSARLELATFGLWPYFQGVNPLVIQGV